MLFTLDHCVSAFRHVTSEFDNDSSVTELTVENILCKNLTLAGIAANAHF